MGVISRTDDRLYQKVSTITTTLPALIPVKPDLQMDNMAPGNSGHMSSDHEEAKTEKIDVDSGHTVDNGVGFMDEMWRVLYRVVGGATILFTGVAIVFAILGFVGFIILVIVNEPS